MEAAGAWGSYRCAGVPAHADANAHAPGARSSHSDLRRNHKHTDARASACRRRTVTNRCSGGSSNRRFAAPTPARSPSITASTTTARGDRVHREHEVVEQREAVHEEQQREHQRGGRQRQDREPLGPVGDEARQFRRFGRRVRDPRTDPPLDIADVRALPPRRRSLPFAGASGASHDFALHLGKVAGADVRHVHRLTVSHGLLPHRA